MFEKEWNKDPSVKFFFLFLLFFTTKTSTSSNTIQNLKYIMFAVK